MPRKRKEPFLAVDIRIMEDREVQKLVQQKGRGAAFLWLEILMKLQQYEKTDVKDRVEYVTKLMKTVDVLLLDDFGSESGLGEVKIARKDLQELLFSVANSRINLQRNEVVGSTIITTNSSLDELERMYNPKLISRLLPHQSEWIVDFSQLNDVRR